MHAAMHRVCSKKTSVNLDYGQIDNVVKLP